MSPPTSSPVTQLALDDYLEQTIDAVNPDYRLIVNKGHLKSMLRALMDLGRVEFGRLLREYKTRQIWNASRAFCCEHLLSSSVSPPLDKAPQYREGLEKMDEFQGAPERLFSFLARGRTYKGKFERLLEDVKPEIVAEYHEIFREVSEKELLEGFVNEQEDPALREELLQCVNFNFKAEAPEQLADGGKSFGQKGEFDLVSFLETRQDQSDTRYRLLAPTWIKHKSNKAMSKKTPYVIELPPHVELDSVSNELDAVLIEENGDSVRLVEVWEAKASLHPVTLGDALSKKYGAITAIVENEAHFNIEGERFKIHSNPEPIVGIFGSSLLAPKSAARRAQMVLAENLLETDATVVRKAMVCGGFVKPPVDLVRARLESLYELAKKVKPTVIVSSEVDAEYRQTKD